MEAINLRLFIGAITLDTTKEELFEHFSKFGNIKSAEIVYEKKTSNPRPFSIEINLIQKYLKGLASYLAKIRRLFRESSISNTP